MLRGKARELAIRDVVVWDEVVPAEDALPRHSATRTNLKKLRLHLPQYHKHSFNRVAPYTTAVIRELGGGQLDLEMGLLGALGHDVGKICLEPELIYKPRDEMEDEDWIELQKHVMYGVLMFLGKNAPEVAYALAPHHDYNGSRKISVLPGRHWISIHNALRGIDDRVVAAAESAQPVIALADSLAAATEPRSYKKRSTLEEAEQSIREKFTGDPNLADVLFSLCRE